MFRILGHLYVGSDLAAESKSDLDTHEITKLLSLEEKQGIRTQQHPVS